MAHEAHHIFQQLYEAGGWSDFYGKIACEYLKYGFDGITHPSGTYEFEAYHLYPY